MTARTQRIAPFVTVAVATLIAALPWGLPAEGRLVLPLLPLAVLHYWALRPDGPVGAATAFTAGLVLDLLTDGPLGYWSLLYLLGLAITLALAPAAEGGPLRRWALFAVMIAVLAVAEALLALVSFGAWADWRRLAAAAGWGALGYPLASGVLRLVAGARPDAADSAPVHGGAA